MISLSVFLKQTILIFSLNRLSPVVPNLLVYLINSCGMSQGNHIILQEDCFESFIIYPNPASSEINIDQNNESVTSSGEQSTLSSGNELNESKKINTIKIIDNFGIVCIAKNFGSETTHATINISNLKNGTYVLIINEGTREESHVFIKN